MIPFRGLLIAIALAACPAPTLAYGAHQSITATGSNVFILRNVIL